MVRVSEVYFFALSKLTGIESFFSIITSGLFFLLRANRVEFERIHNLSTPLILLRAKRVGFESFLLLTPLYTCKYTDSNKDIIIIMHTFLYNDNAKTTSQIPLVLLWAKQVRLRGCVSSRTPLDLLGAKKNPRGSDWKKALNPSRFAQSKQINLWNSDQSGGSIISWEDTFPLDLLRANLYASQAFRG